MENNNKLFDLSTLQDMLEGNDVVLNSMLTKFVEISPKFLNDINASFNNHEFDKVKKIAHEIKPTIDMLNINELKAEIRLIEKDSADVNKIEELRQLITKLNNIYTKVMNEIAKLIY